MLRGREWWGPGEWGGACARTCLCACTWVGAACAGEGALGAWLPRPRVHPQHHHRPTPPALQGQAIETEGYQPLTLPGVIELEHYLPARLLNPKVSKFV